LRGEHLARPAPSRRRLAPQSFADYKTRGPVVLKPSDTAELIEKLEDSQMQLGSMATNRYSAPFREQVQSWAVKLSTVSEILEQWLMVQVRRSHLLGCKHCHSGLTHRATAGCLRMLLVV
jgi:hypothetical protein